MITGIVIELLIKRIWYRSLAAIRRMLSASVSHETLATRPSAVTRLPTEIVHMIIAQLSCDMRSLRACSLTCYSWYIAAVPHLYHLLITPTYRLRIRSTFAWSEPLRDMHELGLLPLVKTLQIPTTRDTDHFPVFSPTRFNRRILRHFSALTNVQELGIESLDVSSFVPRIRRYFGHLLPSVRSLSLRSPKGSRRQIIYFIGSFQHLEDLKLLYDFEDSQDEPAGDPSLLPPFAPPLRGRLTLMNIERVDILKDMIDLFGGIRFRYMDLGNVNGVRLLLYTCAKTLETLRLYTSEGTSPE